MVETWTIRDGFIPYLEGIVEIEPFDGWKPAIYWKSDDETLPYKDFFPIEPIDDVPKEFWMIKTDLPYKRFMKMELPHMWVKMKSIPEDVILSDYKERIIWDTRNSEDIVIKQSRENVIF